MTRLLLVLAFLLPSLGAFAVDLPQNRPNPDRGALERQLNQQTELPAKPIDGFVHIPDAKAGVLVQPMGRTFRDVRTKYQPVFDAALIIIAVAAMAALYFIAGSMRVARDPAGRTIRRFTWFERLVHWFTAVSFLWLSATGLNLVFGRYLLEPLIGDDAFASLSALAKLSHNSVGVAFIFGLAAMTVQWMVHNLPTKLDIVWLKMYGGMLGGPHPPARKFNAGQKMIYWIAVFGGGAICLTGVALLVPFYFFGIEGMQVMHVVHSVLAALVLAVVIGHIYLGSIGIRGSFEAMATGRVDVNWAHEHHGLWFEEEQAKRPYLISGPIAGAGPTQPAE